MKNIFIVLMFLAINLGNTTLGQNLQHTTSSTNVGHPEEVFVHYNSSLLIPGETLYYQFYSRNSTSKKLSALSKVGYLELVDANMNPVFKHKVDLTNGIGQGDFFIPTSLASGNYKLLGYTRWMAGGAHPQFFQGDIMVINPYVSGSVAGLSDRDSTLPADGEPRGYTPEINTRAGNTSNSFKLTIDKAPFKKRGKVQIFLDRAGNSASTAEVSLSVRKLEEIPQNQKFTTLNYTALYQGQGHSLGDVLPDLRGQLISGRITGLDPEENAPIENQGIAFSIPGDNFFLRIAGTQSEGTFSFNLDNRDYGSTAMLQVVGEDRDKYEIILDPSTSINYGKLDFSEFKVSSQLWEMVKDRSIYNQINNSYFEVKQDSVLAEAHSTPFYGYLPEVYELNDFTRFPTLRETFIEIIKLARIKRGPKGVSQFDLTGLQADNPLQLDPLVLVDGLVLQEHEALINYDARKIKSIEIQREKYFLGPLVYQGIISVKTIAGNFYETLNYPYLNKVELINLQEKKKYFTPTYTSPIINSRIPDYRIQLIWKPGITLNTNKSILEFYTSDVSGDYEVSIEGFTGEGEPISLQEIISVE